MIDTQHQIDRLRPEMEKSATENNKFKNLIKKSFAEERIHIRDELEILYKKKKNEVKNQQSVVEMLITREM